MSTMKKRRRPRVPRIIVVPKAAIVRDDPDVRNYLASQFTVHRNALGLLVARDGLGVEYIGPVTL